MYNSKFITYSHGNFIFDQMWSRETREGLVGRYIFYENSLVDVEFLPVLIEDFGQPYWLEGEAKQKMLHTLQSETQKLNQKIQP
jgi:poly-gamma-glutamate capsule biosynthesis protein CapA/YwtB (metallophosphatase superfamily)